LGLAELDSILLGSAGQQDPTLLTHFGSVLSLVWQSDPTTLGAATKPDPTAFDRKDNTTSRNS